MTDERITAYLLGELPREESERFEEECFADDEWPGAVGIAEEDLIDAYLRGELNAERRRLFEENYLTTEERRRRVTMAAGFLRHVDAVGEKKITSPERTGDSGWASRLLAFWAGNNWAVRAGLAVGMVALVAGAVWVLRSRPATPGTFATLTLTLSADSSRAEGSRAARVRLPADADALRVHLKLPEPSAAEGARYRVELVGEEGGAYSIDGAGPGDEEVTLDIPATRLAKGQYALRLFMVVPGGTERRVAGLYYFIVE